MTARAASALVCQILMMFPRFGEAMLMDSGSGALTLANTATPTQFDAPRRVGAFTLMIMARMRRSRPSEPGFTRRRAGKGWSYSDEHGERITDPQVLERIRALVIPPAWTDVWICPWPHGHLQALGTDQAGRRQYLYHPDWRQRQDRAKHQ